MATLYEITGKYGLLMERLEEDGTDIEEVLQLFDDLGESLKEKAEGYGKVRANYKAQITALRDEEKRLADKRRHLEKIVENLEKRLFDAMKLMNVPRIDTDLFSFRIQKNGGAAPVIITEPDKIPPEYLNVTVKPDLKAIAAYLEETGDFSCAELGERGESLRIK